MTPPAAPPPSGLLVIDKPAKRAVTCMTVCRAVRRKLIAAGAPKGIKVGHAGTLDPLASGVVVVLVGRATRLVERVMAGEKRYLAEVDLSRVSPTEDHESSAREVAVEHPPSRARIEGALTAFVGTITQRPPAHSAAWVRGQRAYRLARRGAAPEMPPRFVEIRAIDIVDYRWPILRLDIRCAKGTYIRSLARDLGAALGVGGMLASLRRTAVGPFAIDAAKALESLPERLTANDLLDPEAALAEPPAPSRFGTPRS